MVKESKYVNDIAPFSAGKSERMRGQKFMSGTALNYQFLGRNPVKSVRRCKMTREFLKQLDELRFDHALNKS